MEIVQEEVNKAHELHRLGKKFPKQSVVVGKKHPHHRGINIPRCKVRQVRDGLRCFR